MKFCPVCKVKKDDSEFYTSHGKVHGYCKSCTSERSKQYYTKHDEIIKRHVKSLNAEYKRHLHFRTNYKLSIDEYNAQLELQEYKCKICKKVFDENTRPVVDHDHKCCPTNAKSCGKCLRAIICMRCNSILGYAFESEETLLSAVEYMRNTKWQRKYK